MLGVALASPSLGTSLALTKPGEVGFSPELLKRIDSVIQKHVEAKDLAGAVTLIARKGKVVHFAAHGSLDFESDKPLRTDSLFRLHSMTKPVTAVAVLMLMEEGSWC